MSENDGRRLDAIQWRREDGVIVIRLRDGTVHGFVEPDLSEKFARTIDHAEFHWWQRKLTFRTDRGDRFDLEVGTPRNPNPRRGRLAVYLDQNHMSTLSKALRKPGRLRDEAEWWAALRLIKLAGEGRIVVPFSAAHTAETAAWTHDDARHHLATTILSVSAGWQLRDPLQVRHDELTSLQLESIGREATVPQVVTLEPNAALISRLPLQVPSDPEIGGVPAMLHLHQSTLWLNVATSMMLDDAAVPKGSVDGWTERVQKFSDWLQGETERSKLERRRSAAVFMFADETGEASRAALAAGLTPEEVSRWGIATWTDDARGRPAVSVFRSVMIDKLLTGHTWEGNDLTDLMYLSTAAGYCDFVAGDRRTIALLRQSKRRLGLGVELHSDLTSLVRSVELRLESDSLEVGSGS